MRHLGIALVALLASFQISSIQAQTVVYDVDVSAIGVDQGLGLHVFGLLAVDLISDQVQTSELKFQIDGSAAEDLFLIFNNDDGTGIVDFFDSDGELFVIAETNSIGTLGPFWETSDQQSSFDIFSGLNEVGGVILQTSRVGGDFVKLNAPSPQGSRLGQVAVPEPSASVIIGMGLVSMIIRRRKIA